MAKHNVWMSVSDLMTGLMIIFLFIAVSYISKNQEKEDILREYIDAKNDLHNRLEEKLAKPIKENIIELSPDLSMKFTKAETCFDPALAYIKPEFAKSLDSIMPIYFDILLHDTLRSNIKEIRIEGHTEGGYSTNKTLPYYDPDPFIYNINLSQCRSREILKYIINNIVSKYNEAEKKQLRFWLTASGMGYSRMVNSKGEFVTELAERDRDKSRRVEIRLITKGDEILENFVKGTLNKEGK